VVEALDKKVLNDPDALVRNAASEALRRINKETKNQSGRLPAKE
jgi:hypothetical protein